jgi:hypothetical protein
MDEMMERKGYLTLMLDGGARGLVPIGQEVNNGLNLWMGADRNFFFGGSNSFELTHAAALGHLLKTPAWETRMLIIDPFRPEPAREFAPLALMPDYEAVVVVGYEDSMRAIQALGAAIQRGRTKTRPRVITVILDALAFAAYQPLTGLIQQGYEHGFYFWLHHTYPDRYCAATFVKTVRGNHFARIVGRMEDDVSKTFGSGGLEQVSGSFEIIMPSGKRVARVYGTWISDYDTRLLLEQHKKSGRNTRVIDNE